MTAPHRSSAEREPLTKRQKQVYRFIRGHIKEFQRPPTIREIVKQFQFSDTNSVTCHLNPLIAKGWIEKDPTHSCGIRLTNVKVTIEDL
jgi:repressor LexA